MLNHAVFFALLIQNLSADRMHIDTKKSANINDLLTNNFRCPSRDMKRKDGQHNRYHHNAAVTTADQHVSVDFFLFKIGLTYTRLVIVSNDNNS